MTRAICPHTLEKLEKDYRETPRFESVRKEAAKRSLLDCAKREITAQMREFSFSLTLGRARVTDQKNSGRCWIHAALSLVEDLLGRDYEMDGIRLSHNFISFYDLLEKSNLFLELVISTAAADADDRLLCHFFSTPIQDAGQWDMFLNIIQKYGVVAQGDMPETTVSENTGEMVDILSEQLRAFAGAVRDQYARGIPLRELREQKTEMLSVVYRILCIGFGVPPRRIDLSLRAKGGGAVSPKGITPVAFYDTFIKSRVQDAYLSVIHYPLEEKGYGRRYELLHIGNVLDGNRVRYLNLSLAQVKELTIAQLKAGTPVWFGCDARRFVDRDAGIFDLKVESFADLLGTDFELAKSDALKYRSSGMTHAMLFRGVHIGDSGGAVRWLVQNSYGPGLGNQGYFVMSDDWFDRYVFQVVIDKARINPDWIRNGDEVSRLQPWSPMGMLALAN